MKAIQSRDNPFFKALLKLATSARQRGKSDQALLDGTHLLAAYLEVGMLPQHVLVNEAALQDAEVISLLGRLGAAPVTQLNVKLLAELSELKTPPGILALIDIPPPTVPIPDSNFALLLEDIQDPGNLGSILRSAAAAGCDAVYLSVGCADAWSPKVLRAAMGGHFALNIYERKDLPAVAQSFEGTLLATSLQATCSLYDNNMSGNIAFIIGNEGAGLSDTLMGHATQVISIPMQSTVESLNAAAATAICLFEVIRQRRSSNE
jgi:TrmH family RNA methyltransferase